MHSVSTVQCIYICRDTHNLLNIYVYMYLHVHVHVLMYSMHVVCPLNVSTDQHFSTTVHLNRGEEHLREGGVKRELYHLSAKVSQCSEICQCSKDPQLVHGVQDVVLEVTQGEGGQLQG